ncbi:6-carboxytetrahydropterin synthase [Tenacibaculum dicentrarchi]|uniref:6-carboxy-5,6,7,8-tetrahydropterin synthase n=1 Tax=Tenacibaculum dicentrarchi TaxID=669041 RepID=A0ABP1EGH9_9FLAO|nr:6-carboxytetrahydropterin synthase [Tenacibaculum dicentrarchi]MCD8407624.1 6-carboxytetrahydropterin synthase [Tenacibaculum dicentrarchi]MCD8414859.1 6-carboxytetrahydropterin synthase [Tenacibaculum dicentrarchi]MCD8419622.1 6-carboxytetrahydropterin synthase [Tenacibaculum dicentrarchi]MCD8424998.1 6-carboxytetrahydropterin synthase [Tenacibaculum dicentrarchi]
MPKVTVHRKAHFNAAHRLFNPDWSDEKNQQIFGKCSNPNYHGHNYDLIVSLTGEIDKETGYVYDLGILKTLIKDEVEDVFDHKNLNLDVADFENLNPTAENISVVIFNKLRGHIPVNLALEITLYETQRNYVTYNGS